MTTDTDTDQVDVPVTHNPLTPQEMSELRQAVNPLAECNELRHSTLFDGLCFHIECT